MTDFSKFYSFYKMLRTRIREIIQIRPDPVSQTQQKRDNLTRAKQIADNIGPGLYYVRQYTAKSAEH